MTAPSPSPEQPAVLRVPIDRVDESPFNKRQRWGNLEELAACLGAIVAKAEAETSLEIGWLRLVARGILRGLGFDDGRELMKRRGLLKDAKQAHSYEAAIGELIATLGHLEVRGLIVEMIAARHAFGYYQSGLGKSLVDATQYYKVDPKKALAESKKQQAALQRGDGVCRECGCTEDDACETEDGPCSWAEPDLCSACAVPRGGARKAQKARGKRG